MKAISIIIISLIIDGCAYAQYNLLIRGGINYSDFQGENRRNSDGKTSFSSCKPAFYCGLTYYKSKIQYVHFEASCNLTTKRFSCDYNDVYRTYNHSFDGEFKLHILDLSVYPVVGFGTDRRISFSVQPSMGILVYSHFDGWSHYGSTNGSKIYKNTSGSITETQGFLLTFEMEYNLQYEYKHTDKISYFYEIQFSHTLLNASFLNKMIYKANNYKIGAGIRFKIGKSY